MKKSNEIWTIVLVIIVLIIANYFFEKRKDSLMLKSKKTIAIITDISKTSKGPIIRYKYFIEKNKYISRYHGGSFVKELDTILIKYSIKEPSLSEVIDFCYMQKYKGKCN